MPKIAIRLRARSQTENAKRLKARTPRPIRPPETVALLRRVRAEHKAKTAPISSFRLADIKPRVHHADDRGIMIAAALLGFLKKKRN